MNILRTARVSLGITLDEAAHRVGTNAGNLSRIERDRQFPSPPLALRLCQVYGVSLDDIYRAAGPPFVPCWRVDSRPTPAPDRSA